MCYNYKNRGVIYMKSECTLCPRRCKADRQSGVGFCGESDEIRIARAALHPWEEPCISGEKGSGTVFFSGCSLRCVFCQNYAVSRSQKGRIVSTDELVKIYFDLAKAGASNINLVTPTHFTLEIAKSIDMAKKSGIGIPFVWNSGGYESVETLKTLDGLVDIYMPDLKYASSGLAKKYSAAKDYPSVALAAIKEMKRQQPEDIFEDGLLKNGVLIRHLVLPGCTDDSLDVLDLIKENFGKRQLVSVMSQYTPFGDSLPDELKRTVTAEEYDRVTSYALLIGLNHGYFQEGEAATESFIPPFDDTTSERKNQHNSKIK